MGTDISKLVQEAHDESDANLNPNVIAAITKACSGSRAFLEHFFKQCHVIPKYGGWSDRDQSRFLKEVFFKIADGKIDIDQVLQDSDPNNVKC
ncbi:MAG: hypothetical protein K9M03_03090 [Kiritimatiellales bacterium]|nr:hypothetical protein [Kiritimatiellales bacterium]